MALEFVDVIRPHALFRQAGGPLSTNDLVGTASGMAVRLLKSDLAGFTFIVAIPGSLTMGTGLTFILYTCDDGKDATDLGLVFRIGITVKRLVSGTDNLDIGTSAGTEQTTNITLNATTGVVVKTSAAVALANLDSAAVGDAVLVRLRRIGNNAADTCLGAVLLTCLAVANT